MIQTGHEELENKLARIRLFLDEHNVDGLLLRRVSSFAWATCGASSYVNTAATEGAASLFITRDQHYLVTNNIEAPRLQQEEGLAEQEWDWRVSPWTDSHRELNKLISGKRLAADVAFSGAKDVSAEMAILRANLTQTERDRLRELGRLCSGAIEKTLLTLKPGMSEYEIAAQLGVETRKNGVQPIVNLIATDERVFRYRHPLPTKRNLDNYAMLVLCGRKWGLVASITRLIHFGKVPAELKEKILAAAQVNATMINATRPGKTLGEVLSKGQRAYADQGFPDEWKDHHQGGAVGYEPREYLGLPNSTTTIVEGQAYAWNPSIRGAKVEDTILVEKSGNEVITLTPTLPEITIAGVPCSLALEIR